ncbi:MAG: right-handed parallel beta-helix repeat-containing protein [Deltaproteobacteria bacterium]|nr:right-handed parallel beta-helix repeat-containing protein [Deltaproteobacteria bacterium]MBK8713987.1 right-handed parallel beta-helix repeat-containing protein [Deltaproteobacteria bacterium]MBP7291381.1 right-handed parallel beta-helix repeat-containing protein [Nannocystaceae bacterium]
MARLPLCNRILFALAGLTPACGNSPAGGSDLADTGTSEAAETHEGPTPGEATAGTMGSDPTTSDSLDPDTGADTDGTSGPDDPPPPGGEYPLPPGVGSGPTVYAAADGDDAQDGLTLETAVRTLDRALELAEPGSIIEIGGGEYEGFMVSDGEFGTEDQWILMRPLDGEDVTITSSGDGPTIYFYADACDEDNGLVDGNCTHAFVRLEGLRVQGSPNGGGDGNAIKIDTPRVQLVNNRLCCSVADVIKNVRTADDTVIYGNEIYQDPAIVTPGDNAQGIDITGADRLQVVGNYLHDLTDIAAYAKGNSREVVFEGNMIADTGKGGEGNAIMCGQSTDADRLVDGDYETYDCMVRNNVIAHVAGACVAVGSSRGARVYNNTCFDTATMIHAALMLTNESEVGQPSTDVEFRGNIVAQSSSSRVFTDTEDLGMTDWSTLVVGDNLYFAEGGAPVFTLNASGLYDGGDAAAWNAALSDLTGHGDASTIADPKFVDTTRLEPSAGSPAVDAMPCLVGYDFDGQSRPSDGEVCDIGAIELD